MKSAASSSSPMEILGDARGKIMDSLAAAVNLEIELFLANKKISREQVESGEYLIKQVHKPEDFVVRTVENPMKRSVTVLARQNVRLELYKRVDVADVISTANAEKNR